jgi:hypothetical protein
MESSYREIRIKIVLINAELRSPTISDKHRAKLQRTLKGLIDESNAAAATSLNTDELRRRRKIIDSNQGLQDVFIGLWIAVFPYTRDNVLTENGYIRFFNAFQIAMLGFNDYKDFRQPLALDWKNDTLAFGELNKEAFFDLLFELIEIWMRIINKQHHAAFAWVLLDSLVDISHDPIKLRKTREIRCLTESSEIEMYSSYIANKENLSNLNLTLESLKGVPDTQRRINERKWGMYMTEIEESMLAVVSSRFRLDPVDDSGTESDDDGNLSHQSSVRNVNVTSVEITSASSREGRDFAYSPDPVSSRTFRVDNIDSGTESDDGNLSHQSGVRNVNVTSLPRRQVTKYRPTLS